MRPAGPLVTALVASAILGSLVVAGIVGVAADAAFAAALALVALLDGAQVRSVALPRATRDLPSTAALGIERVVTVRLRHDARSPLALDLHDLHPAEWPSADLPRRVVVPAGREALVPYRLTPIARGVFRFEACELMLRSPLRLWRRRLTVPCAQTLRVFPNFAPLAQLALVGAEQASRVIGAHLRRRRGEGTEFHQLREYRTGDALRQIDWKATGRVRKLISRDYHDERNQQVVLVLDTGRRMAARDATYAHFDHVLNALLMVAYIALRRGDAVGLLAIGGESRFVPPRRGPATIHRLLEAVFDLAPRPVATDYLEAATQLAIRQSRRALVLIATNVRDDDVEDLLLATRQLQRRHLVCVASLREEALDEARVQPVRTLADATTAGALARYLDDRSRAHAALRAEGVPVLDVTSRQFPGALVDYYLAVKRAAML
ncbi:MAG TPA: DUF58 domain-containing protein [Candidatus Saccharimonadia bacterium]|nr:DUF58 domain-containing protein [Candidatus Saccharimonadia bacterium]